MHGWRQDCGISDLSLRVDSCHDWFVIDIYYIGKYSIYGFVLWLGRVLGKLGVAFMPVSDVSGSIQLVCNTKVGIILYSSLVCNVQ